MLETILTKVTGSKPFLIENWSLLFLLAIYLELLKEILLHNIQKGFRFIGQFLRHVIWKKIKSLHQSLGFREVSSYLDKFLCQEMNMTTARQVRVEGNNCV